MLLLSDSHSHDMQRVGIKRLCQGVNAPLCFKWAAVAGQLDFIGHRHIPSLCSLTFHVISSVTQKSKSMSHKRVNYCTNLV